MDPYQRIKAREAIEHEYFDDLRAKDPEYNCQTSKSSIDAGYNDQDSDGKLLNNKRILSPELLNNRSRGNMGAATSSNTGNGNFNLTNKNSYTHASHHNGVEASRRSDNGYGKQGSS